jgi:hypothetical protein
MNRLINASALTVPLLFSIAAFAEGPAYIASDARAHRPP